MDKISYEEIELHIINSSKLDKFSKSEWKFQPVIKDIN